MFCVPVADANERDEGQHLQVLQEVEKERQIASMLQPCSEIMPMAWKPPWIDTATKNTSGPHAPEYVDPHQEV